MDGNHSLPETTTDLMQEGMFGDLKCGGKKEQQYVSPDSVLEDDGSFPQFTYQRI